MNGLKKLNSKEQHQETNVYAKNSPSDYGFSCLIFARIKIITRAFYYQCTKVIQALITLLLSNINLFSKTLLKINLD